MDNTLKSSLLNFYRRWGGGIPLSLVLFSILLQIQVSLFAHDEYKGVRINLADIILPFYMSWAVFSVIIKKSKYPILALRYWEGWLLLLLFVMTVALFRGYAILGYFSIWALINKYVGLVILVSYFVLGAWFMANVKKKDEALNLLSYSFVCFFVLILFLSVVCFLIQPFLSFSLFLPVFPWEFFMGNRNALMVLSVYVLCIMIVHDVKAECFFSQWVKAAFWSMLPIFWVYNASRTGWVVMGVLFLFFIFLNFKNFLKNVLPFLVLGMVLAYGMTQSFYVKNIANGQSLDMLIRAVDSSQELGVNDKIRKISLEDGWDLYAQSNPFLGAGLGVYKPFQIEKRGKFIEIIDFTGLWLLTEVGLLGLCLFGGFFFAVFLVLVRRYQEDKSAFLGAIALFLFCFAGISLLHEVMYTRFVWFVVGIALTMGGQYFCWARKMV